MSRTAPTEAQALAVHLIASNEQRAELLRATMHARMDQLAAQTSSALADLERLNAELRARYALPVQVAVGPAAVGSGWEWRDVLPVETQTGQIPAPPAHANGPTRPLTPTT
jgi:hypothetical protein